MKKILSTVAAATLIATSSFALDTDKLYGEAALAIESIDGFDSGTAVVLTAGVPVMEKGEAGPGALAVEVDMSFDLTSPSTTIFSTEVENSLFTLGGYAAYTYDINDKAYVKPRLGLIYISEEASTGTLSVSSTTMGLAMGVKAGYKINEKIDAVVGYNIIASNASQLTIGAAYRF